MNVVAKYSLILVLVFSSFQVLAGPLEACLSEAQRKTLIIDQKQAVEYCFQTQVKMISKNKCFAAAQLNVLAKKNTDLLETLSTVCFYQGEDFTSVKACLDKAGRFKIADNHDEAVFECYRQFQSVVSQKQCIEISRKLIYPGKKNYLLSHCQNNY